MVKTFILSIGECTLIEKINGGVTRWFSHILTLLESILAFSKKDLFYPKTALSCKLHDSKETFCLKSDNERNW